MAMDANSRIAPAVHPLTGSTPPGADALDRLRTSHEPKACSQTTSDERQVNALAQRLVALLKREPVLVRRLDMLRLHELLPEKQVALDKVLRRTWRRIDGRTRRLSAMKATTLRAAAHKGAALIETADVDGRSEDPFDALALSLANDVGLLGVEAAFIPQHIGGNFAAYHHGILEAHAAMEALPPGTPDAASDAHMDRWGAIDRLAMMDRPKTMADAVGALAYARREFHQFHVEMTEASGEEVCGGDKLILHLLDGASAVLRRVVQEDASHADLSRSRQPTTMSSMADVQFEPWDFEGWQPPTNTKWSDLANPYLVTSRLAYAMLRKTKPDLEGMVRTVGDASDTELPNLLERLQDAIAFFGHFRDMASAAETRLMSAGSSVARQEGEPQAQPDYDKPVTGLAPDRRAVAAYRQWLDMEQRLLGAEMYPEAGADAVRFVPMNTASRNYHLPLDTGASWRDLPQPTSRAEAMCRVLGIDWTTDEARDERYLPVAPAVVSTRAA